MDPRLAQVAALYALNTDLALNCVAGLSDAECGRRLDGTANSAGFLLAHLIDTRHFLAAWLGSPTPNPLTALLRDARGIDDVASLPPVDLLCRHWLAVSAHLAGALAGAATEFLDESSPQRVPIGDDTRLDAITFLAQHESYHIGQMGFIRRRLGHPAMSYARRP